MPSEKSEKPLKIVLDTNNLVSSQINKQGASYKIFNLFREDKIHLYTSPFQLKELFRVLSYPRIKQKYGLKTAKIEKIIMIIKNYAQIVYPQSIPTVITSDPSDNQILVIAQEGKVDFIVSGDRHLSDLKEYQNIPIISAKEFLKR